ncbi:hypothetical protein ACF1DY_27815 [Streptomyces albus]
MSPSIAPLSAPDGTVCDTGRDDEHRSLRCYVTADTAPLLHLRVAGRHAAPAAALLLHDALVLPRLWDRCARLGALRPVVDHGRIVGVAAPAAALDPAQLWDDAAALRAAVCRAVADTVRDDNLDQAVVRAAATRTGTSYGLAALATAAARADCEAAPAADRLHAADLTARLAEDARHLADKAALHAPALVARLVLTAARPGTHPPAGPPPAPPDPRLTIRLPRYAPPPERLEIVCGRAELAHVQIRRPLPPVGTVRELAAVLLANQAGFGPWGSALDHTLRFRHALTYLWDCLFDHAHGEFVMLAAPDAADVDRVLRLVHAAHTRRLPAPVTGRTVEAARRIVTTGLLRRLGPAPRALATQADMQCSGLPSRFVVSLLAALRAVTAQEAAAAAPAVAAEPLAVTVVLPARTRQAG